MIMEPVAGGVGAQGGLEAARAELKEISEEHEGIMVELAEIGVELEEIRIARTHLLSLCEELGGTLSAKYEHEFLYATPRKDVGLVVAYLGVGVETLKAALYERETAGWEVVSVAPVSRVESEASTYAVFVHLRRELVGLPEKVAALVSVARHESQLIDSLTPTGVSEGT
jgi:hypothetical protein